MLFVLPHHLSRGAQDGAGRSALLAVRTAFSTEEPGTNPRIPTGSIAAHIGSGQPKRSFLPETFPRRRFRPRRSEISRRPGASSRLAKAGRQGSFLGIVRPEKTPPGHPLPDQRHHRGTVAISAFQRTGLDGMVGYLAMLDMGRLSSLRSSGSFPPLRTTAR